MPGAAAYPAPMSLLLLLACRPDETTPPKGKTPDLTERLGEGEVRAGVVTDEAALFGGVSAEGKAGDVKIYNDRAQFVIQAAGEIGRAHV